MNASNVQIRHQAQTRHQAEKKFFLNLVNYKIAATNCWYERGWLDGSEKQQHRDFFLHQGLIFHI